MAIKTIQSNIKRNTRDWDQYSVFLGALDVSAKNIDQFDPLRTGFVRIFIVRLPRFMEKLDQDMAKRFKHYVEMGFIGVSGIGNTTLEMQSIEGGYANNKFDIPSVCRDETDGIQIKVYENSGSPVREFIDTWMTGICDPLSGLAHYHGVIDETCSYKAANHIMEMFYVSTDPTGTAIEYACLFCNMMPKVVSKSHFEFNPGQHEAVQVDLDFTATRYESPQINEIAAALLNKYKLLRSYLQFNSGYSTQDVDAMDAYNSKINTI